MTDLPDLQLNASAAWRSRPLATFALFAFNQQDFVREAVRAALAQTYRPIEIILSDDASSDRTFEIMEEEAKACPADVCLILNRNDQNLGIGNHINKVVGMSRGEILVLAAGDDISLPHRTQVSVDALLADSQNRLALHGTVTNVDAFGIKLHDRWNPHRAIVDCPEAVLENDAYLTGSSVAVRRSMYTDFPKLNADVVNEDKVTAFRCALFGGAIYLNQPVTMYRAGVGVSTLQGQVLRGREDPTLESRYIRTNISRRLSVMRQVQVDAGSAALISRMTPTLRARINDMVASLARVLRFVDSPTLSGLPALFASGGFNRKTLKIATGFLAPRIYRHYKLVRQCNTFKKVPPA